MVVLVSQLTGWERNASKATVLNQDLRVTLRFSTNLLISPKQAKLSNTFSGDIALLNGREKTNLKM